MTTPRDPEALQEFKVIEQSVISANTGVSPSVHAASSVTQIDGRTATGTSISGSSNAAHREVRRTLRGLYDVRPRLEDERYVTSPTPTGHYVENYRRNLRRRTIGVPGSYPSTPENADISLQSLHTPEQREFPFSATEATPVRNPESVAVTPGSARNPESVAVTPGSAGVNTVNTDGQYSGRVPIPEYSPMDLAGAGPDPGPTPHFRRQRESFGGIPFNMVRPDLLRQVVDEPQLVATPDRAINMTDDDFFLGMADANQPLAGASARMDRSFVFSPQGVANPIRVQLFDADLDNPIVNNMPAPDASAFLNQQAPPPPAQAPQAPHGAGLDVTPTTPMRLPPIGGTQVTPTDQRIGQINFHTGQGAPLSDVPLTPPVPIDQRPIGMSDLRQFVQGGAPVPTRSPAWQAYIDAEAATPIRQRSLGINAAHGATVPPEVPPLNPVEQEQGDPQFRQRFYGYGTALLGAAALGMNWALTSQNNYGPPRI